jgi:hypothetical protein
VGPVSKLRKCELVAGFGIAAMAAFSPATGRAAVITYIGKIANQGPSATEQGSPNLSDGYDLYSTGDAYDNHNGNALGTDIQDAGTRVSSLPGYVSSITSDGINSAFSYAYSTIDDPRSAGGSFNSGLVANNTSTSGADVGLVDIHLTGTVPSVFYIGWLTNVSGTTNDYPTAVHLVDKTNGGDSGLSPTGGTSVADSGDVDVLYFKVAGASSGDTLYLSGSETGENLGSDSYFVSTAGLLFTQISVVPEPATLSIVPLALSGLLIRRRRA